MKEQLITFQTAKLAKQVGFSSFEEKFKDALIDTRNNRSQIYSFYREYNSSCYTRKDYPLDKNTSKITLCKDITTNSSDIRGLNESYENPNSTTLSHCYLAPTQALLQQWLATKHHLIVWIQPEIPFDFYSPRYYIKYIKPDISNPIVYKTSYIKNITRLNFNKYEDALEFGLFQMLKLID